MYLLSEVEYHWQPYYSWILCHWIQWKSFRENSIDICDVWESQKELATKWEVPFIP